VHFEKNDYIFITRIIFQRNGGNNVVEKYIFLKASNTSNKKTIHSVLKTQIHDFQIVTYLHWKHGNPFALDIWHFINRVNLYLSNEFTLVFLFRKSWICVFNTECIFCITQWHEDCAIKNVLLNKKIYVLFKFNVNNLF
jgi:hypothetical protein